MEIGDAVWVQQTDGSELLAHFLAGPREHDGRHVIWVCDDHEWVNATVHFGRDPEGVAYPPLRVRPYVSPGDDAKIAQSGTLEPPR